MDFLDWVTLMSYIALNIDIIFEMRRIYHTKSSRDLSITGMTIRFIAIMVILIKFISLGETSLIVGQGLIVFTFTTYFALAIMYFIHRKGT